jgi:hypothetical protein
MEDTAQGLDCPFCRKYWHYSFAYNDEHKRGKPVLSRNGKLQERGNDSKPDCAHCPRYLLWTDENMAIYGEYMRQKYTRSKPLALADHFAAIDDEIIKIKSAMMSNAVAESFMGVGK